MDKLFLRHEEEDSCRVPWNDQAGEVEQEVRARALRRSRPGRSMAGYLRGIDEGRGSSTGQIKSGNSILAY